MTIEIRKQSSGTGINKWYYLEVYEDGIIVEMSALEQDDYFANLDLDYDDLLEELTENESEWITQ